MPNGIKPCPFCGSTHVQLVCSGSAWFCQCNECDATGASTFDGDEGDTEKAISTWNKVSQLRADLEENWLIVHDEHCTNMRDCSSFGGTKKCEAPRPDSLQP